MGWEKIEKNWLAMTCRLRPEVPGEIMAAAPDPRAIDGTGDIDLALSDGAADDPKPSERALS